MGGFFSKPWRTYATTCEDDLEFVKNYQPRNKGVTHLRILLHGPVGAGKSSFINSVDTVLQGRLTGRALTDTSGTSFTKKYKAYQISRNTDDHYSFIFNDIMGFEKKEKNGVLVEDVKLALEGHVKEGYKFKSEKQMAANDPCHEPSPTLDDRVHVLVSVVPADSVSIMSDEVVKKMKEVRQVASDMDIPQLVILTKIDKACAEVEKNINNAYYSEHLKDKVRKFSQMMGIPENCIFLVKNYDKEGRTNRGIDTLILRALRQMISFGEDYLNNL